MDNIQQQDLQRIQVQNVLYNTREENSLGLDGTFHFGFLIDSNGRPNRDEKVVVKIENIYEIPPINLERRERLFALPESNKFLLQVVNNFIHNGMRYVVYPHYDCILGSLWKFDGSRKIVVEKLMQDVLKGLVVLHQENIVHRDIKPTTIAVCYNGFNHYAKIADGSYAKSNLNGRSISISDRFLDNLYSAPEMIRPRRHTRATVKADIHSVASTFFTAFTNQHLFERDNTDVLHNICNQHFVPNYETLIDSRLKVYKEKFGEHVLKSMVTYQPNMRPTAQLAVGHPIFWNEKAIASYLTDVFRDLDKSSTKKSRFNSTLASAYRNWRSDIDKSIWDHLNENTQEQYSEEPFDLLRLIVYFCEYLDVWSNCQTSIQFSDGVGGVIDYFLDKKPNFFYDLYIYCYLKTSVALQNVYYNDYSQWTDWIR